MDLGKLDCKSIIDNAPDGWTHYKPRTSDGWCETYYVSCPGGAFRTWISGEWYDLFVPEKDRDNEMLDNLFTREEIEQAVGVLSKDSVDSHYQKYVYRVKLSDQDIENGFVDVKLDPYRVANVCGVGGGALEHCLKKAMRGTDKGHDLRYVYNEIIKSAMRGIEMIDEDLK